MLYICSVYDMVSGTSSPNNSGEQGNTLFLASLGSRPPVPLSGFIGWSLMQALLVWVASWNPLIGPTDLSLVQYCLLSECIKGPTLSRTVAVTQ